MKLLTLAFYISLNAYVFYTIEAFDFPKRSSNVRMERLFESTVSRSLDSHEVTSTNEKDQPTEDYKRKTTQNESPNIVLVAGFESFNTKLYQSAAEGNDVNISVFADKDIRGERSDVFEKAVSDADCIILSLIFDYDDVSKLIKLLERYDDQIKCRLVFESATEIMKYNRLGTFSMYSSSSEEALFATTYSEEEMTTGEVKTHESGPPPAVKAILSKFSSGKEEDKLQGYLQLLKSGPELLKYFPGEKVADLKSWLEVYRFWQQGGSSNVHNMIQLLCNRFFSNDFSSAQVSLTELEVTPDIGLIHPLHVGKPFTSPSDYLNWRLQDAFYELAIKGQFKAADIDAPVVAVLLYRKHVITEQSYIRLLLSIVEGQGLIPVPIFINGVEAHTIVRDLLTSTDEIKAVKAGEISYEETFSQEKSVIVDAIVSTIGFPLVGGPAGSMQAGRNIDVAKDLLAKLNIPYFVAAPLLLQDISSWRSQGVQGLQSVVLYSLPELDGAIDATVLGGLVGDVIALVPERVRKLCSRIKGWIKLRETHVSQRKIAISVYGFPPNVGAVGTAALLDVPHSLENLLKRFADEGYDVGHFASDPFASGESLRAALAIMSEDAVIAQGAERIQENLNIRIKRSKLGDITVSKSLSAPGGGLGGAFVKAFDITNDELNFSLGKYMSKKVERAWGSERGPGVSSKGNLVVSGLQLGNVWITVQPLLGVEGDPMRMLFERDLTPHRQYCASYEWMKREEDLGGIGAQAIIHLGMHGTVEWLPGLPLGNDRRSWSDELLGSLPNVYVYAANNPSESILAKRRGYGTLVSYNVPPYGRAGLYLELTNLKDLMTEYRNSDISSKQELRETIWSLSNKVGITKDVPISKMLIESTFSDDQLAAITNEKFDAWVLEVSDYLVVLQDRLFSSGLHVLGNSPSEKNLKSYLTAYFGDKLTEEDILSAIRMTRTKDEKNMFSAFLDWLNDILGLQREEKLKGVYEEAKSISKLLLKSTEEVDGIMNLLNGGYILPAPGGDLLRDGASVLPTGRNIHALDPYRMPSAGAWVKGQRAVDEILSQHQISSGGAYPETIAVTLWGLDAIKTRGESVAIAIALVGAEPVKEGTGRIVRFDLRPLDDLGRPRIDVLASLSGIFRDSFANIVDLLDDLFERTAQADEPIEMNYIKKHAEELKADGVERPAARLFSNPPGDYGSMVNEVIGTGEWENEQSLGETWRGRNTFSYGRGEGQGIGRARPEVLDKLLSSTDRIVQEIDSVEYGLTDIQEYYANTGALKKAAENRRTNSSGGKGKVQVSIIEAFGNTDAVPVQDLDHVLRIEYRSKLLNPKWRDAMVAQGSGGAYEVSQRMTAMVGWAATSNVDNFVFDQAAERYALDEEIANKLRSSNPEAFKNVIRRLLEAEGRGYWDTDEETLQKLRELYSDADDMVEQVRF